MPSEATVSRRGRTVGLLGLLGQALARLAALFPTAQARRVDGKPMPVGGRANDRDARRGHSAGHNARGRGYSRFLVWGGGVGPDA